MSMIRGGANGSLARSTRSTLGALVGVSCRTRVEAARYPLGFKRREFSLASTVMSKIKKFFVFFPDAPSYIQYAEKSPAKGIKGHRYPAPGETGKTANIPEGTDPYDTTYYTTDPKNFREEFMLGSSEEMTKAIAENSVKPVDQLNLPKDIPQVLEYDPSGTRASATTSPAALRAKLIERLPTHLPAPWWYHAGIDDYTTYSKPRGLPPRPGTPARTDRDRELGNW